MPDCTPPECRSAALPQAKFVAIYSAMILLSLHWAIVLYINSSYLEQYVNDTIVGFLYTIGSLSALVGFYSMSQLLNRAGKHKLTLTLSLIELLTLIGLATTAIPVVAVLLFVVHQMVVPLILFNLDIYMEETIGEQEHGTGTKRAILLTIMSLAGAVAPLLSGYLIGSGEPNFSAAYLTSALLMIPFIIIIWFRFPAGISTTTLPQYSESILRRFWQTKDLRNVFAAHFLLQFFFTWMVIYTPIFLANHVGLNWTEIGQILFVGLLAYVLFEYAIGVVADRWLGEKEMMALGFLILIISTSWFTFIGSTAIGLWMFAMFMTRVGASLVEVTTESYFFKQTRGHDTDMISFFRSSRPLSIIIGALLGSLTLSFVSYELLFVILGILLLPGFFFAMAIKDTK